MNEPVARTEKPCYNKSQNKKTELDKHILITTYSPGLKTPRNIIEKHWPILGASNATSNLYNTSVTYGHRRACNVRDIAIRVPEKKENYKNTH